MIPVKTHFDHSPLLDAVHRRYSQEMKAARDDGHPLSRVDALAVEFRILKEEFNEDHYRFYAGLFYPIFKEPFLSTSYWSFVRFAVLTQYDHRCYHCGGAARQIHHAHYGICGEEHLHIDDNRLVPLCHGCHSAVHDSYDSPDRLQNRIFDNPEFRTTSPGSPRCFVCMKYHPTLPQVAEWVYAEPNGEPEVDVSQTMNFLFCGQCREQWIRDRKFAEERFIALKDFELSVWAGLLEAFAAGGCTGSFSGIGRPRFDPKAGL